MAKHAEKRAHENAAYWSNILQVVLAIVNVLYPMSLLYSIKESGEWSFWTLLWPFIYAYLEYKTYQMLISALQSGLKPEYSLDAFAVILLSHCVAIFSDIYATYILYLFPAYIVFKALSYLKDYIKQKSNDAMTANPAEEQQ
mmetsp:Transcript_16623/g.19792  ORF Transcript_16623/g.19792 Transcript_16623/m.19792 type:complete len:142 (+) Transcript_16623:3-428(+)